MNELYSFDQINEYKIAVEIIEHKESYIGYLYVSNPIAPIYQIHSYDPEQIRTRLIEYLHEHTS